MTDKREIETEELILPGDMVQRLRDGKPIGRPMVVTEVDMPKVMIEVERNEEG